MRYIDAPTSPGLPRGKGTRREATMEVGVEDLGRADPTGRREARLDVGAGQTVVEIAPAWGKSACTIRSRRSRSSDQTAG